MLYTLYVAAMAGSIVQTTFAALSFAGAGYLFKTFDKNGYSEEMKRHNHALEELARAKEKFYENEVKHHDRIQELRQHLADANKDIVDTNKALDLLGQIRTIEYKGVSFDEEPSINNFYRPSEQMKNYQNLVMAGVGDGTGLALHAII